MKSTETYWTSVYLFVQFRVYSFFLVWIFSSIIISTCCTLKVYQEILLLFLFSFLDWHLHVSCIWISPVNYSKLHFVGNSEVEWFNLKVSNLSIETIKESNKLSSISIEIEMQWEKYMWRWLVKYNKLNRQKSEFQSSSRYNFHSAKMQR